MEDQEKELGALAGLLIGSNSGATIAEIQTLLKKLEKDKKIMKKNNYWVKYRK
jgi:cysteine synthase